MSTLGSSEARRRLASARVARLATVAAGAAGGEPHVVPVTFAVDLAADVVYTAVDHKPKRTTALRRLADIAANPAVSVIADHYEEDWAQLWWARADGVARVLEPGAPEAAPGVSLLVARYEQYRDRPPAGPVVAIAVRRWSGWAYS